MSKKGQFVTNMIGLQDSVLALGQFLLGHFFGMPRLFTFPVNSILICIACKWIIRILAPIMYIFFASALPVIAFGEQLSTATSETLPSCYYAF